MKVLHDQLISILKQRTPEDETAVSLLTDLLPISKEGGYRRLRGDILLTLDEVISMATKMEISLDNLIEVHLKKKYSFHISPYTINSTLEEYAITLKEITDSYNYVKVDPQSRNYLVCKLLSPVFYFKYKEFSRFILYKWIYIALDYINYSSFSSVITPSKLEQLYEPCVEAVKQITNTCIISTSLFESLVDDINYFVAVRALTKEEADILKQQALMIIDDMEEIAERGCFSDAAEVVMYITDIHLDTSYYYLKGNGFESCSIGVYGINFLSCLDEKILAGQRIWIETLIKYSTLISTGGDEKRREEFFNEQRKVITQS